MASRYVRAAGGDYSVAGTWASTSGGIDAVAVPTSADDVFLDILSGQLTIDAAAACLTFNCTGYTGTLTHNAFVLTVSGSVTLVSGMTYTLPTPNSSTITIAGTGTLTTGGKLIPLLILNTGITCTLGDGLNFAANKYLALTLNGNSLNLNGQTVSGNSVTNRVLIRSNIFGTARTITNTTGTFANADFRDITLSSAVDLSAITGLSGDCGGNTGITFTTAATQTYTGGTGNWSTVGSWTSRVPLPQDDVLMSGVTGGTITADMKRLGKSIDWTGASGTPTFEINSTTNSIYGSLTLISAMNFTTGSTPTFEGRGSFTLTSAGKTFSGVAMTAPSGTLTLADSYTGTGTFTLNNGTLVDAGYSFTNAIFSSTNSNTRAITRSGTWTLTSTGTVYLHATATNLTLTDTGTIAIMDTSATSKTLDGGGKTYNNLSITGGGSGAVIITGANTFNQLTIAGGTKSITLPGSTTTTLLSGAGLGNGTNVITFTASAGSATVSVAAGTVSWNYVNLTNIPRTGGAVFYAGANSTDGGGNTGWNFINAPGGGSMSMGMSLNM